MSFFKEERPYTPGEETEREEALFLDYLQGLWQEFRLTGNYEKLTKFVEEGGDIDKYGLRKTVANMMRATPAKGRGGPKDAINIAFYMDVEAWMLSEKFRSPDKKKNLSAALRHVGQKNIEGNKAIPLEGKTADKRYRKGKLLFIEEFEKPWIEDESSSK